MKVLLATSNLYKTNIQDVVDRFLRFSAVDGVQLCPGNTGVLLNVPSKCHIRHHENYANWGNHAFKNKWLRLGKGQYTYIGSASDHSVHPPILLPRQREDGESIFDAPELDMPSHMAIEVMAVGTLKYPVCTVQAVRHYMKQNYRLAIDLSHIDINIRAQNNRFEWLRLLEELKEYPHITELHMSQAMGLRDAHAEITKTTFGLDFLRQCRDKVEYVILESNMHRKSDEEIQRQINILIE